MRKSFTAETFADAFDWAAGLAERLDRALESTIKCCQRLVSVPTRCSHGRAQVRDRISAMGESRMLTLEVKDAVSDFCHICAVEETIECAKCRRPIFIGDNVRIWYPIGGIGDVLTVSPKMKILSRDRLAAVACMRPLCAGHAKAHGVWWRHPDSKGVIRAVA